MDLVMNDHACELPDNCELPELSNMGTLHLMDVGVKHEKGTSIRGENGACALDTSGSCVLDLFFQLIPHVAAARVHRLLDAAWKESAHDTLKIIFQTGNAR